LKCEMSFPVPKFLKKCAVNYKMTVRVDKVDLSLTECSTRVQKRLNRPLLDRLGCF
jgi:hypothetical protein